MGKEVGGGSPPGVPASHSSPSLSAAGGGDHPDQLADDGDGHSLASCDACDVGDALAGFLDDAVGEMNVNLDSEGVVQVSPGAAEACSAPRAPTTAGTSTTTQPDGVALVFSPPGHRRQLHPRIVPDGVPGLPTRPRASPSQQVRAHMDRGLGLRVWVWWCGCGCGCGPPPTHPVSFQTLTPPFCDAAPAHLHTCHTCPHMHLTCTSLYHGFTACPAGVRSSSTSTTAHTLVGNQARGGFGSQGRVSARCRPQATRRRPSSSPGTIGCHGSFASGLDCLDVGSCFVANSRGRRPGCAWNRHSSTGFGVELQGQP